MTGVVGGDGPVTTGFDVTTILDWLVLEREDDEEEDELEDDLPDNELDVDEDVLLDLDDDDEVDE